MTAIPMALLALSGLVRDYSEQERFIESSKDLRGALTTVYTPLKLTSEVNPYGSRHVVLRPMAQGARAFDIDFGEDWTHNRRLEVVPISHEPEFGPAGIGESLAECGPLVFFRFLRALGLTSRCGKVTLTGIMRVSGAWLFSYAAWPRGFGPISGIRIEDRDDVEE